MATYADYKDYGGVKVPGKIDIQQGGHPAWELAITSAMPNAPLDLPCRTRRASATVPPVEVTSTELAPGVWHLAGGSTHSGGGEFANSFAIIEAPLTEARSLAVLAEARKLVPNKPLTDVVTTHHHFDHTGGLRTYAAEGATIVTTPRTSRYFQKVLVAPATISPDAQAKAQKTPTIQAVSDSSNFGDAKQKVQVHATTATRTRMNTRSCCCQAVLVEGDAYSPGPVNAPPRPRPTPLGQAVRGVRSSSERGDHRPFTAVAPCRWPNCASSRDAVDRERGPQTTGSRAVSGEPGLGVTSRDSVSRTALTAVRDLVSRSIARRPTRPTRPWRPTAAHQRRRGPRSVPSGTVSLGTGGPRDETLRLAYDLFYPFSALRTLSLLPLLALAIAAPALAQHVPSSRTFSVPAAAVPRRPDRTRADRGVCQAHRSGDRPRHGHRAARLRRRPANALELARQVAANPPVTQDGATIRLRPPTREDQQRAVTIRYRVIVPAATEVESEPGSVPRRSEVSRVR